ncbi:MAG TPA: hypothetical protein VGM06_20680 [Polyangiaceae bacterium]
MKTHSSTLLLAVLFFGCDPADYDPPQVPPPPPPVAEPAPMPEPYTEVPAGGAQPPAAPAGSTATSPTPPPAPPPAAPAPAAPTAPSAATTDQTPLVYSYPTGQWVYLVDHGWVWIPAGATAANVEGVPYVWMYTPDVGWTWYVSPWGWGPYHYGIWYRHPWHPVGWHGRWIGGPHVTVRLGRGHR